MSIRVLRPGLLSTLQDAGRHGYQHIGVPVSGAMDAFSHRVANLLAGNEENAATLEMTLRGPQLQFLEDALIAICGADLSPSIGRVPVPEGRPVRLRAGTVLEFGACVTGCRAYLALGGGFDLPPVLGSRSTYALAGIGGLEGRALKKGDTLPAGASRAGTYPGLAAELARSGRAFAAPRWSVNQHIEKLDRTPQLLRILPGVHWDAFPPAARERLTDAEFRVAPESNRMGYRLEGPSIDPGTPLEILSRAVAFGTIQVPPGGQPIVLMADRQTTGGYPMIADVAGVDLHLLAQLKPGDRLRFQLVSLAQAHALCLRREQEIVTIREAVALRLQE